MKTTTAITCQIAIICATISLCVWTNAGAARYQLEQFHGTVARIDRKTGATQVLLTPHELRSERPWGWSAVAGEASKLSADATEPEAEKEID